MFKFGEDPDLVPPGGWEMTPLSGVVELVGYSRPDDSRPDGDGGPRRQRAAPMGGTLVLTTPDGLRAAYRVTLSPTPGDAEVPRPPANRGPSFPPPGPRADGPAPPAPDWPRDRAEAEEVRRMLERAERMADETSERDARRAELRIHIAETEVAAARERLELAEEQAAAVEKLIDSGAVPAREAFTIRRQLLDARFALRQSELQVEVARMGAPTRRDAAPQRGDDAHRPDRRPDMEELERQLDRARREAAELREAFSPDRRPDALREENERLRDEVGELRERVRQLSEEINEREGRRNRERD
ncbi:hypothetical protein [Alienimonas californiensis]|nr:hypothetical protein [Alienimonas californiensis]